MQHVQENNGDEGLNLLDTPPAHNMDFNQNNQEREELTCWEFLRNLGPNLLSSTTYFLLALIERHYAGKQSTDLLDGLGLSKGYIFLFGYYMGASIADSIGIICPKYFGARNFYYLGQTRNLIAVFIVVVWLIYTFVTIFFSKWIISFLTTQSEAVIIIASDYAKYMLGNLLIEFQFNVIKGYFQAHLYYTPTVISSLVGIVVYPSLAYVLIEKYQLMELGAAIAFTIDSSIKLILMLIFMLWINPYPESNVMFNRDTFNVQHLWKTLKICIYNLISVMGEVIGFQILIILASRMQADQFSIFLICASFIHLNTGIGMGWMLTLIMLIGKFVGANKPNLITRSICFSFLFSLLFYIPILILFIIFRIRIMQFFTNDNRVLKNSSLSLYLILVAINLLIDFIFKIYNGIFKGIGKVDFTYIVSVCIFSIFYPITGYILGFVYKLDLVGLYISIIISYIIGLIIFLSYFYFLVDLKELCATYMAKNLCHQKKTILLNEDVEFPKNKV